MKSSAFAQPIAHWNIVTPVRILLSTVFFGGSAVGVCEVPETPQNVDPMASCARCEELALHAKRPGRDLSCDRPGAKRMNRLRRELRAGRTPLHGFGGPITELRTLGFSMASEWRRAQSRSRYQGMLMTIMRRLPRSSRMALSISARRLWSRFSHQWNTTSSGTSTQTLMKLDSRSTDRM